MFILNLTLAADPLSGKNELSCVESVCEEFHRRICTQVQLQIWIGNVNRFSFDMDSSLAKNVWDQHLIAKVELLTWLVWYALEHFSVFVKGSGKV